MKTGICPKCGSHEVYGGTEVKWKSGGYNFNCIPITAFTATALDNYVCVDCGYVESYVTDKAKIQKLREKWPKV